MQQPGSLFRASAPADRIAVTGATGFVGRRLVPALAAAGAELLLVGREPERIGRLFPGLPTCGYDDIAPRAAGFDVLVHLAAANSDADLPEEGFRDANVRLLLDTAERARRAGIARFVNVSSVHALDPRNRSAYARSKREAAERLAGVEGIDAVTLYLPAVHGDGWSGRMAFLGALPASLARALFPALAAFRPTLHVSRLADFVLERTGGGEGGEIVLSDGQQQNLVYRGVKRAMDLAFALSVLVLFWWGLALIWALVRLQSPGPGIFAQERVGRDGRIFTCYKFRTMRHGTAQVATNRVPAGAVTRLGRFLRRTKLDELPQVWNILRNEISLVGPRPCLPGQGELVEARRRRGLLGLKPGISGLAQVNGIDMSEPQTLARWDARYLALQSLALDLRIMLATARGKGGGDKAVRGGQRPQG